MGKITLSTLAKIENFPRDLLVYFKNTFPNGFELPENDTGIEIQETTMMDSYPGCFTSDLLTILMTCGFLTCPVEIHVLDGEESENSTYQIITFSRNKNGQWNKVIKNLYPDNFELVYDQNNRIISIKSPIEVKEYIRNKNGDMLEEKINGKTTCRQTYDSENRLIKREIWQYGPQENEDIYEFVEIEYDGENTIERHWDGTVFKKETTIDNDGNKIVVKNRIDKDGRIFEIEKSIYDKQGRLKTFKKGDITQHKIYLNGEDSIEIEHAIENDKNWNMSVSIPRGEERMTLQINNNFYWVKTIFDSKNRPIKIYDNFGNYKEVEFDDDNLISSIKYMPGDDSLPDNFSKIFAIDESPYFYKLGYDDFSKTFVDKSNSPHFYKMKYDKNGNLIDIVDEFMAFDDPIEIQIKRRG